MFIRYQDASTRGGGNVEIRNYITKAICDSFSLAIVTLNGAHPRTQNNVSDRAYFVVEGEADVEVGTKMSHVQVGDAVYIPKDTAHSITGKVRYVVVNAPPFDPGNEKPA